MTSRSQLSRFPEGGDESELQATEGLSRFITECRYETLPEAVLEKARQAIVDAFAAILCGAASELGPVLFRYLANAAPKGRSPVLGTGVTTSAEMAALVNGTFGAALEYDDVFSAMPGHPAAIIVPALCADAERGTISGKRFLEAFVVGYEVGAKVALGIGQGHYGRGFHATGTLAMFSALGALAKLRRMLVGQIRNAFGVASSMAAGVQCNFGTMVKPLHSGWAARCALAAVDLTQCGLGACTTSLEEMDGGFLSTYGTAQSDATRCLAGLGEPWAIVNPGFALKKFPSCYAGHRAMDGILRLRGELGLTADNVESVLCRSAPGTLRPMRHPAPTNGLESKFSIPYALAAGVLDGRYTLWTFTDEAVNRPQVRALLPKMTEVEDPRCLGDDPNEAKRSAGTRGFVEVEARTLDGRASKVRVDLAPGNPLRPLTWEDIEAKLADCAASAGLEQRVAGRLYGYLRRLDDCEDLAKVLEAMRNPARAG